MGMPYPPLAIVKVLYLVAYVVSFLDRLFPFLFVVAEKKGLVDLHRNFGSTSVQILLVINRC